MVVDSSSVVLDSSASSCAPVGPFVPRPFPPPALENVPLPYILDQLHNLAIHYWDKPETADCTIVVPIVPTPRARPTRNSTPCSFNMPLTPPPEPTASRIRPNNPAGLGRRVTEPTPSVSRVTRMTSKLHLDYLLAQSSLFRALFSGRSPLEHMKPTCPDSPTTPPPAGRAQHQSIPPSRLPRILPSSAHPLVFLPLPHPASFPHLVHYMYFGTTSVLEDALNRRQLRWDDVVRNVEYLGMRTRIKVFLGRWYANWLAPSHARVECRPPVVHEDEEDGYDCASDYAEEEDSSEDDMEFDDDDDSSSSTSSDYDSDTDVDLGADCASALTSPGIADAAVPRLTPIRFAILQRRKSLDVGLRRKKRLSRMDVREEEEEAAVERERRAGAEGAGAVVAEEEEVDPPRGRTRNRSRPNAPEHSPTRKYRPA